MERVKLVFVLLLIVEFISAAFFTRSSSEELNQERDIIRYELAVLTPDQHVPYLIERFVSAQLQNQKLRLEKNNLKREVVKFKSPVDARTYIEVSELLRMDMELSFPSKEEMIQTLNSSEYPKSFRVTFANETFIVANEDNMDNRTPTKTLFKTFSNLHAIKWLYYLSFVDSRFSEKIRNILKIHNVSILNLCDLIEKIYSKTNGKSRVFIEENFDAEELKRGLKQNGLLDKEFERYVDVILDIHKETVLLKGTLKPH